MEGQIMNFRLSRHRKSEYQMIVQPKGVDSKEKAAKLSGKTVVWKTETGKEIKGKITQPHGGKGAVRVHFETGMPGQALSAKVEIQ